MDLYVRDVDPVIMRKLDELAKRKKVSRAEYVRQMVRAAAVLEEVHNVNDKYEQLVQTMVSVIMHNTETIERLEEYLHKEEN